MKYPVPVGSDAMNVPDDLRRLLDATARILIRCVFMNVGLALLWWLLFMVGRRYEFHTLIFNITPHEFALITYCGIAFIKLCNIVFFIFPYIAIRWVLRDT